MKTTPLITLKDVPYYNKQDRQFRDLSQPTGPSTVTQNYIFRDNDTIDSLQVDATSGNITITLPSPTGNRRRRVIKTDSSANSVTITAGGVILIGAETTATLSELYRFIEVEPTGTAWLVVSFGYTYTSTNGDVQVGLKSRPTNATGGFLFIPSCAGTPTGVPGSYTGRAPLVIDSTNNKLYFYSGGAWRDAGP